MGRGDFGLTSRGLTISASHLDSGLRADPPILEFFAKFFEVVRAGQYALMWDPEMSARRVPDGPGHPAGLVPSGFKSGARSGVVRGIVRKQLPNQVFKDVSGGERGIRTPDTVLPYTHFPGVRLQPLGHLSRRAAVGHRRRRSSSRSPAKCQPSIRSRSPLSCDRGLRPGDQARPSAGTCEGR